MKNHDNQSGNVLFYILIAVGLIAALSFAVTQSGRGSARSITEERARLFATEIIEYSNNISAGVTQLRLRGVDVDELCFDDPNWGAANYDYAGCADNFNRIFNIEGAGITWSLAPEGATQTTAAPDNLWHIYGDNEIQDVGTTCGNASCSDLILVTDELDELVCRKINKLINSTIGDSAPPTDSTIGETRYIGDFDFSQTIGDEAGGVAIAGKNAGCFERTSNDEFVFYKVLIAR